MDGKQSATWFKVLALCGALGLGGGYVWLRQKHVAVPPPAKETELVEEVEKTVLPGSKSFVVEPPDQEVTREDIDRVLMSSSKVGIVELEDDSSTDPAKKEPSKKRTVLPGSKAPGQLIPDSGAEEEQAPGTDEP